MLNTSRIVSAALAVFLMALPALATAAAPVEEILGQWKGTSICRKVPGNESCNDEVTVYVVTRASKPEMVTIQADKIVNGQRQNMGTFDLTYSDKDQRWEYEFTTRVHALWTFKAHGRELTGMLFRLPEAWVARDVKASKEN